MGYRLQLQDDVDKRLTSRLIHQPLWMSPMPTKDGGLDESPLQNYWDHDPAQAIVFPTVAAAVEAARISHAFSPFKGRDVLRVFDGQDKAVKTLHRADLGSKRERLRLREEIRSKLRGDETADDQCSMKHLVQGTGWKQCAKTGVWAHPLFEQASYCDQCKRSIVPFRDGWVRVDLLAQTEEQLEQEMCLAEAAV